MGSYLYWRYRFALLLSCAAFCQPTQRSCAERLYVASDVYAPQSDAPQSDASSEPSGNVEQVWQNAREACEQGDVGRALRLATDVVMADPDHAEARRVLGYRRIGEQWAGSYAARRLERGEIWDPRFGWIAAADVPRYEAGQRPLGKRWISAQEDARRHATIDDGWRVRTDHFRVTTNHSREAAAQLATRLEALYQVWQQLFGGFYLKSTDLLKRFDGKEVSGYRSKPFEVIYYRTRDEYNAALRRQQPRIAMTLGIYFDTTRQTHFFAPRPEKPEEQDPGTINHEAVHQFFHESNRAARNVGDDSNAWLIEGVACYFESLQQHRAPDGRRYFSIGTAAAGRLPAARHRRLVDDFYVPLAELSALGIKQFQARSDLPRLYSQSAGLATFLMQHNGGEYRPALVKTLQFLYAGRVQTSTLEGLTGRSFGELDRQYREYLESLPVAQNAAVPAR
ncbi:MAG: alkyl sulfatase dimerization domain-containing protein [Bythopirellula sp.]